MDGKRFVSLRETEKNVPLALRVPTSRDAHVVRAARDETSRTIRLSVESLGQIHYASFSQDCVGSYLKYQMCGAYFIIHARPAWPCSRDMRL